MNRRFFVAMAIVFGLACVAPGLAIAHEFKAGDLLIGHPWMRATPPGAKVAAGYLSIKNSGSASDRLVGAIFEAAARAEIHEMKRDGDVMRMRPIEGGLEIPAGGTIELKPNGMHLMFHGLTRPLTQGPMIKGTLVFEKAGTVPIEFKVEAIGATGDDHMAH
jgi:periplasmic copper chaperone A